MPRFDLLAAKAAGHSDQEIADYLSQRNAAGAGLYVDPRDLGGHFGTGVHPGGIGFGEASPESGADADTIFHPQSAPPSAGFQGAPASATATAPQAVTPQPAPGGEYPMLGMMLGGVGGGLLGGPPGALTGAGWGAATGRAIQGMQNGEPVPQLVHDASGAGLTGMGQEAAGQFIVNPLLGAAAHPAMQYALKSTPEEAATALKLRTAVGPRITPGPAGVDVASATAAAAKNKVLSLIDSAEMMGHRFDHRQFLPTLESLVKRGELNALSNEDRDAFKTMLDNYMEKYGPKVTPPSTSSVLGPDGMPIVTPGSVSPAKPLTPAQVQGIKEEAQNAVKDYYERMGNKGENTKTAGADLRANKAIASVAQKMLEGIPGIGKQIAAANRLSGDATQLTGALTRANNKPLSITGAGMLAFPTWALSHNPTAAAAMGLLAQPWVASRAALAATDPLLQQVYAQAPGLLGMMQPAKAPVDTSGATR